MLVVISTGWKAPTKQRCIDSVKAQVNIGPMEHVYIEASEQKVPKCALENVYDAAHKANPEDILCFLDGDDWFPNHLCLRLIESLYDESPYWVTYGQFQYQDGRPGFAGFYPPGANIRKHPWLATHLKTMRAGLFQKIRRETFLHEGEWRTFGWDLPIMFPAMEMAGMDRVLFNPWVVYTYNYDNAWEQRMTEAERRKEQEMVASIRAAAPYKRIDSL